MYWPCDLDVVTVADSKSYVPEFGRLWRAFDRLRGTADAAPFGIAALALVFVRAFDEPGWTAARSSHATSASELLRNLPHEISAEIDPALRTLRDLPAPALAEMMDALEPMASGLGNAATFRLLLDELAAREGSGGGTFHTPESVAAFLASAVNMRSASSVYDPFCRAGELLVAAAARARSGSESPDLLVRGGTPNSESLATARMNTQLHEVPGELKRHHADELADGTGGTRKFSRILTNPPFNLRHWTDHDSACWRYGPPPKSNANFAWLQYVAERLEPGGQAAVVMPNGALFSANPRERDIRMRMVEDGCVEALISLPPALFWHTSIPVTIWLLSPPGTSREEILFIEASHAGHMVSRTHRELGDAEIVGIVGTIDAWRSGQPIEVSTSAVSVALPEVREREYNLNPSVYLGRPPQADSYETTTTAITLQLRRLDAQHHDAAERDAAAQRMLKDLAL